MTADRFWERRRVLITGVSGFLGSWLARLLLEAGAEPVGLDLVGSSPCLRSQGIDGRFPIIEGSVLELEAVKQALDQSEIQTCFHLAGQSKIEDSAASPIPAFELNVRGTWTVLEACRQSASVVGVACASSDHTYGRQDEAPFKETAPFNQLDVYGASKACADLIVRTYAHQFGVPAVAVRNTNSFGPADPHISHIVTGTVLALARDEAPVIRSDGSAVKAYLYAQDTMEAYMRIGERAGEPGVRGEAFNVTAAEPIRVLDLVDMTVRVSGKTHLSPVVLSKDLSQKDTYENLSSEKVQRVLGWGPRFSLEEGLRLTYEWYAEHGTDWLKD